MNLKLKFLAVCFFVLAAFTAKSQPSAIPASRVKAADALLVASGLETQLTAMYSNIVDASSAQVPDDKKVKFKEVMLTFLNKYMSYATLKQDMAEMYAQEFTEDELKQITQFYLTPAGKKMNAKMAVLQQKGMQIGQQKVQAHMAELQEEIKKAFPGQ